jgi:chromosome segregation ATPase
MDQTRIEEFLQDYPKLQEAVETLGAKLTKAEKQIYALEEGLAALARHLRQLEEAIESSGR